MRSSRDIIVNIISDLHNGSSMSLCSLEPEISDLDTTYRPNALQREMNECWFECIDDLTGKADYCVLNGEPIDGANKRQLGNQSWTTNLMDQVNDSVKLVKEIPYDNIIVNRGSGYHVQQDGTNFEEVFADKIGAAKNRVFGGAGLTDYYCILQAHGKNLNFTHHIGFNKWAAYRTTGLAREMAGMVFEKDKMAKSDAIIRSHVHYFVHVEFTNTHGLTTPCWKYPDAHLFRGGLAGTTPDLSIIHI